MSIIKKMFKKIFRKKTDNFTDTSEYQQHILLPPSTTAYHVNTTPFYMGTTTTSANSPVFSVGSSVSLGNSNYPFGIVLENSNDRDYTSITVGENNVFRPLLTTNILSNEDLEKINKIEEQLINHITKCDKCNGFTIHSINKNGNKKIQCSCNNFFVDIMVSGGVRQFFYDKIESINLKALELRKKELENIAKENSNNDPISYLEL